MCEGLLCALQNHPQLAAKVAEVIASFAREGMELDIKTKHIHVRMAVTTWTGTADGFRDVAVACAVVPGLCPLLASGDKTVQLHTLRAIGNLCFDHGTQSELCLQLNCVRVCVCVCVCVCVSVCVFTLRWKQRACVEQWWVSPAR